ncbi:MAG: hypothetical protein R2875_10575 [Desulfobacterales bacterium]
MDGGERIAQILKHQGVEFVFTLCGGVFRPFWWERKRPVSGSLTSARSDSGFCGRSPSHG